MSQDVSRASSAQSDRLPPVRPSSSQSEASDVNLNKHEPLPPITTESGKVIQPADSETIANTMAGSPVYSGKGRRPKITNGFRRETDEDSLSGQEDYKPAPSRGYQAKKASVTMTTQTIETQTDWSWMEDMQMIQRMKTGKNSRLSTHSDTSPRSSRDGEATSVSGDSSVRDAEELQSARKKGNKLGAESTVDELKGIPKTKTPGEGRHLESEMTFASESSIPYPSRDDEYGIPILALSSESEESDDEDDMLYPKEPEDGTLPSIGPPEILKYQKESDKEALPMIGPEGRVLSQEEMERLKALGGAAAEGGMFEGTCEFCGNPIKSFPTLDEQRYRPPEELYCCNEYQEFVLYMVQHPIEKEHLADKKIDIKPHPPYGSKQARRDAKEKALQRMREREMARQQQAMAAAGIGGGGATFYQFARQMKTINYQLSSQKCLEEGWTLRPPTPLDEKDLEPEIFEPEPMPPPWADSEDKKARRAGLIQKFYPDGSQFLILFSDGTGTVFYPSGRVAISITSIEQGLYTYIVQPDAENENLAGVFEPNGVASTHYTSGALRLYMDPIGGVELDAHGHRKRKWSWKDWRLSHVHAPPIQPITCALTPQIGVRIMGQENMTLTFTARKRSVRFQVGAKLKLVAKELPPRPAVEEDELYREEVSNRVQSLFNKVANLLKFPNSPKLHKLPSPPHLSSKAQRLERIREEQGASGKKYTSVVTVN